MCRYQRVETSVDALALAEVALRHCKPQPDSTADAFIALSVTLHCVRVFMRHPESRFPFASELHSC